MKPCYLHLMSLLRKQLSLILLVFAMQFSFTVTAYAVEDRTVVVLFGDSITQGYNSAFVAKYGAEERNANASVDYGEPDIQLSKLLNQSHRPSLVVNMGYGGTPSGSDPDEDIYPSNNGVGRIDSSLSTIKSHPDYEGTKYYVLIIYGTNDYAYGIGASTTGFNTRLMIQSARNQGYTPVVGTIPPNWYNDVTSYNAAITSAVSAEYSNGTVYFANHYSILNPSWGSLTEDGVHPTDAGYLEIAKNWFNTVLENLIEQKPITVAPIISLLLGD